MTKFQCQICHDSGFVERGRRYAYDLRQCTGCGTVVVDPLPTQEEVSETYQGYYGIDGAVAKKAKKIRRSRRRLIRLRKYLSGNRLIDVGCNHGYTVAAALDLGFDAFGIDIDGDTIKLARDAFGRERFEAITVEDFADRGETFDLVYTAETIEHTLDPDGFMAALAKLLRPGGLLYLTTPDAGHLRVPKDLPSWSEVDPPHHIFLMTKQALDIMVRRYGLSLVKFQLNVKPGIRLLARKD